MKNSSFINLFYTLTFVLFVSPLQAEELFEGELRFKMSVQGKDSEMTYLMQGPKMRMEIELGPGMESIGIADYEKKKITMLMPQGKMYSEMDINQQALTQQAEKDLEAATITETNETEEILGYECEKLISSRDTEVTEIWIAKNFGKFYSSDFSMQNPTLKALQAKFEEEKAFPFRIVTYSPDKRELFRMQVTKVEKRPLEKSLFEIPADYQKFKMPPLNPNAVKK